MIRLVVSGEEFNLWQSAEVERSIDEFAHRFSLSVLPSTPFQNDVGDAVSVFWDEDLLITGYTNRLTASIRAEEQTISVEGRSTTGDLVDCSATHKTNSWSDTTVAAIVRDLLAPFDIPLTGVEANEIKFPRFALESGESVHDALDRLCKVAGLLPVTRANGAVQLIRVEQGSASSGQALSLDRVFQRTLQYSDSDRHSVYKLRATGFGPAEYAKADVTDSGVNRWRPLVVIGDAPADSDKARIRAVWERNIRAGRSERVRYSMLGAHTAEPGTVYDVYDPDLGVDEPLVMSRSVIRVSGSECMTELELCRPATYSLLEYSKKKLSGTTKSGKPKVHFTTPRG